MTPALLDAIGNYLKAFSLASPRLFGFALLLPFFNGRILPAAIRGAVFLALTVVLLPPLAEQLKHNPLPPFVHVAYAMKEMALGFLLGFPVALIFLVPQSVGDFIDNQRGAGVASLFNPAFGGQSNLLGIFLGETFLAVFLALGGMALLVKILYDSYLLYPVLAPLPPFNQEALSAFVGDFANFLALIVKLAAPVIFVMMVAEIGLGLIGRFAPQLQVFFLAMSLKSVLAIFFLIFYTSVVIDASWQEFTLTPFLPLLSR